MENQEQQTSADCSNQMGHMLSQFDKACSQIALLQLEINNIKVRRERSQKGGNISFLYQLQIRQLTLQEMLRVYGQYAKRKAVRIVSVGRQASDLNRTAQLDWIEVQNQSSGSWIRAEHFIDDDITENNMNMS